MNKDILFTMENEDAILKAVFDIETEKLKFKAQNEEEKYYSLEEIENVKNSYIYIFKEDENVIDQLISKIKKDEKLIDKIKKNQNNKLMFMYQTTN
ncbi:MAG: hypothetical protein ACRCXT_01800 [Paraclostridium sp.]